MLGVDLVGDAAKSQGLRLFSKNLSNVSEGLAEAGTEVRDTARRIVPKRTGRLAASITVYHRGRAVIVAATAPYAVFVHQGSIHNPEPVPFMELAAKSVEPQIAEAASRYVDRSASRAGL